MKVLADLLGSQHSALHGEVLHLISKHNIVKARSGLISDPFEVSESRSSVQLRYQLANEPTHSGVCCRSKVSGVSAANHF